MTKRTYDQFCGLAKALDLVGERWTLLIVRDLSLGPQRYSDLLAGEPGIGTGLLADRLRHLEEEGLVQRTQLPPPAAVAVYELTPDGRALAEAMLPLAVWGAHRLDYDGGAAPYRPEWLFLAVRAQFKPHLAKGVRDVYEFDVDGTSLHVRIRDGDIDVQRGPAPGGADVTVTTDATTLLAVGIGRESAQEAIAAGRATIEGSPEAIARCQAILGPA
ncbi:MAG TPA: helix-turn-helix domain-containing protein [Acidimicrobiales bacterium]